jgi:cytochrome P450
LRNFIARIQDPIGFFERLADTYGDVCAYPMLNREVWLVNDPLLIQEILVGRQELFQKAPALKRASLLFGDSLLVSEGSVHARQRKLVQPAFHRQRIAGYAEVMANRAGTLARSWSDGETIEINAEMYRLTLGIVAETLFGSTVQEDAQRIARCLDLLVSKFHLFLLPMANTWLRWPLPGTGDLRAALRNLDAVIYRLIADRRQAGEDRGDLLSMLLAAQDADGSSAPLTDIEVRDQAMTIFLAGHETTANAMTWACWLLARHPAIQERLAKEARDAGAVERTLALDDVPCLNYTRAVMAEAMRLYPPVWILGREALCDLSLGGFAMPRNAIVVMSQWRVHRDSRWWPDPLRFAPERWLEPAGDRPKFAYFPFGGGSRLCVGESFAWTEGVLILATILANWRFSLPNLTTDEPPACTAQITLRPRDGIRLILKRRSAR